MIPHIRYEDAVERLRLGHLGLPEFKGCCRFYLCDSALNRLYRIRKRDWFLILEDQKVVFMQRRGRTIMKYDFSAK